MLDGRVGRRLVRTGRLMQLDGWLHRHTGDKHGWVWVCHAMDRRFGWDDDVSSYIGPLPPRKGPRSVP